MSFCIVVLLIPLAGVGGTSNAETPGQRAAAAADSRPNIVLILTDDMRFGDRDWMPATTRLLRRFRMTQFLSNHPMCCPARAELITGQYAHHNGVFHNKGPFGSDRALRKKNNTLAAWLYDAGYSTGLSGKWLNEWAPGLGSKRPYGWTHFNAWIGEVYSPFAYTSYNDGRRVQPRVHTNDAVTRSAVRHIKEFGDGPFFVYASYISPHAMFVKGKWGPPVPAPRHANVLAGAKPSYQGKPSFDYGPEMTRSYQHSWRERIRSLQSVDEGVRAIIDALRSTGELRTTVVIFTSDNGMLLGEHRHHGKNVPWEEALRVPLYARGPGVPAGVTKKVGTMLDLAPSIAGLAGVTPGRSVDGRSDLIALGGGWTDVLIQAGSDNYARHFSWRGIRTPRWTYAHWTSGRKQLFDRLNDPYQLRNLAGQRPKVEARLARLTPDPY